MREDFDDLAVDLTAAEVVTRREPTDGPHARATRDLTLGAEIRIVHVVPLAVKHRPLLSRVAP